MPTPSKLYLLRHAQAVASAVGGSDFDRMLDRQGLADAAGLGDVLAERGTALPRVVVSPSARTRQTWQRLDDAGVSADAVQFDEALYNGSLEAYEAILGEAAETQLMIIGHNPAIAAFAGGLASRGEPLAMQALARGFPTCALAVLRLDGPGDAQSAYLEELLIPPHRRR